MRLWSARRAAAIARAAAAGSSARGSCIRFAWSGLFWLTLCAVSTPAWAEVGATASIFSDQRFRGFSLSDGHPVAIAEVAYDDASGFYGDASGSIVFRPGHSPEPLGIELIGGYAKRLESGTTIDFGVTHSSYSHYSNSRHGHSYSEIYVGVSRGVLSSRIFISPHYSESGRWTAYGEANANFSPASNWSLEAHLGLLRVLRSASPQPYRSSFDWRLGVSRQLGRVSLHAAWVGHGRASQAFGSPSRESPPRSALAVGITTAL
ncbi:MAG: hypothetical protein HOP95_08835 [Sphingomonas sp.]|nr:hypothetical protein [Sphingomonas sp.]